MAYDLTSTFTVRSNAPAVSPQTPYPAADAVAAAQPVPAEDVDSYEIGFRTNWFDGQTTLDLTVFDMRFANFQAQSRDLLLNQNRLNSIGKVGALKLAK